MKRKLILFCATSILFFMMMSTVAAVTPPSPPTEVPGNTYSVRVMAKTQKAFKFQSKTQVRINASVNVDLDMDINASAIGEKLFELNISEASEDADINITGTDENPGFGLVKGNTVQVMNQSRYKYEYGFCVRVQTNVSVTAKLAFELTAQEAEGKIWAFYNETAEKWVTVQSQYVGGLFYCETNHFSTWTILSEDSSISFGIYAPVFFMILASIGVIMLSSKKLRK